MTTTIPPSAVTSCTPFMGRPWSLDLTGVKAAVLGIPFDCGGHPVRVGARLGPAAIREQSVLVRAYEPPDQDFDALDRLNVVDCGDVRVPMGDVLGAHAAIEDVVWRIGSAGAVPVTMGGDGTVTLPQLRAMHRIFPDLVVLHIDAHTDTFPAHGEVHQRFNTATTFTHAASEGLVDPRHSFHIGPRGATYRQAAWGLAQELGYNVIPDHVCRSRGWTDVLSEVRTTLANRPVYLCFDMDYFDPSCAPGVCTPTWGGASAREGLELLRSLSGLRIVACDLNTVSPPHDVGGMTAFLAGTCVREFFYLIDTASA